MRAWLAAILAIFAAGPAFGQFDLSGIGGFGAKPKDPVSFSAQFTPASADQPAVVMVTALIEPGYHVYSITQPAGGPQRTELQLNPSPDYKLIGGWAAAQKYEPHVDPKSAWGNIEEQQHKNIVTWYAPVELAAGVDPVQLAISGNIHLQACDVQCVDIDHEFTARLGKGVPIGPLNMTPPTEIVAPAPIPPPDSGATKPGVVPPPGPAASIPGGPIYDLSQIVFADGSSQSTASNSLAINLLKAFLGGLLLNLMPCVLPVIGLKVLSFVQQAGQDRRQAFALNLWYSVGIISVFLVLAGLAIVAGMTWGEHFASPTFNVVMTSIVFAMALSMLGVWEIPIPGFVGGNTAHELAKKEGPTGAFLKGIVTTLLATPCTGPVMGVALSWAVQQTPAVTLLVFTVLGLGMAFPYLLIGAFPQLVKFLPKPGAWMETFKELMGFVLLGTVVWLMMSLKIELLLPTIALLVGIGFACWVFARTPGYAPLVDRLQTYALSSTIVAAAALFAFGFLAQKPANTWQPFTLANLGAATITQGRTVLVDFSADWCATCKVLEKTVLHTKPVEEAIAANNVVTMYGDFTDSPPEIKQTLAALRSNGVPVIAIFPGDDPYNVIVFRGYYTQKELLEAIAASSGKRFAVR